MTKKDNDKSTIDFQMLQQDMLADLKAGKSLTGQGGVSTPLIKQLLEAALEGEVQSHLADNKEAGIINRKNGKSTKTIQSEAGSFELSTLSCPRIMSPEKC